MQQFYGSCLEVSSPHHCEHPSTHQTPKEAALCDDDDTMDSPSLLAAVLPLADDRLIFVS
jgi:hypothetical protein